MRSDFLSHAHEARVLEYEESGGIWTSSGNLFEIGSINIQPNPENAAGGTAYDHAPTGRVWATGDYLDTLNIYGAQGLPQAGGNNQDSFLVDFDGLGGFLPF